MAELSRELRAKPSSRHRRAIEEVTAKRRRKNREDLLEQEQTARWLSTRELAPSSGDTAAERMQRIRDKVARKCNQQAYQG